MSLLAPRLNLNANVNSFKTRSKSRNRSTHSKGFSAITRLKRSHCGKFRTLDKTSSERLTVGVRCRPILASERKRTDCLSSIQCERNAIVAQRCVYSFEHIFDRNVSQEDLFGAEPKKIVDKALSGQYGAIIAYGQTSSGKTYTMFGDLSPLSNEKRYGIIPRAVKRVFQHLQPQFSVYLSACELYNETLFDLLRTQKQKPLKLVDAKGESYIMGLHKHLLNSDQDCLSTLEKVVNTRKNCISFKTGLRSSRSHALVFLEIKHRQADILFSKLIFADLAGSERLDTDTHMEDDYKHEVNSINKSLSVLSTVINRITLTHKCRSESIHIPFRDSKLTRILKSCLSGDSKTMLITCVNPLKQNEKESIRALRFASLSRNLRIRRQKRHHVLCGKTTSGRNCNSERILCQQIEYRTKLVSCVLKYLMGHCSMEYRNQLFLLISLLNGATESLKEGKPVELTNESLDYHCTLLAECMNEIGRTREISQMISSTSLQLNNMHNDEIQTENNNPNTIQTSKPIKVVKLELVEPECNTLNVFSQIQNQECFTEKNEKINDGNLIDKIDKIERNTQTKVDSICGDRSSDCFSDLCSSDFSVSETDYTLSESLKDSFKSPVPEKSTLLGYKLILVGIILGILVYISLHHTVSRMKFIFNQTLDSLFHTFFQPLRLIYKVLIDL